MSTWRFEWLQTPEQLIHRNRRQLLELKREHIDTRGVVDVLEMHPHLDSQAQSAFLSGN